MIKLTKYETHKLIKADVPLAKTVYESENKGQMTLDEWLDIVNQRSLMRKDGQYEYTYNDL